MAKTAPVIKFDDFTGGLNVLDPEHLLPLNTSPDCQNINLLTRGWERRNGDTAFNGNSLGSAVTGLGYVRFSGGTESLTAVAGSGFYTSNGLTGTMATATGAATITAGFRWRPVVYNDLQIWFGGNYDSPFTYSGTGTAALLGGSPPSALSAFAANNRVFAMSTSNNQSRIYWPVLGNPSDWTGTGSGNADVGKNDGDELLFGVPVGPDVALLFKGNSTHRMVLTRAPFPIYHLQTGIGAVGRDAYVNVNGEVYFITPSLRMKSTRDGVNFTDYSSAIDPIWDATNRARSSEIRGVYYQKRDQIHWYVSSSSSSENDLCLIWDLRYKCWLRHPTGYAVQSPCIVQNDRLFGGHTDGIIYEKDMDGTGTDASEANDVVDAWWRTPFKGTDELSAVVQPHWIDFVCTARSTDVTVSYGFDYAQDQGSMTVALQGQIDPSQYWDVAVWDVSTWPSEFLTRQKRVVVYGRGNVFSAKFRVNTATTATLWDASNWDEGLWAGESQQSFAFHGATVQLRRTNARKELPAL